MRTVPDPTVIPSEGFRRRIEAADTTRKKELTGAVFLVLGEVLFTLSPFIAIWMVFYFKGRAGDIFSQPEWAMVAAVISAQAVVKLVAGLLSLSGGRRVAWQFFSFVIAVVIVMGIIPSLIVLSLILSSENSISMRLVQWQLLCFCVGLLFFISSHYTAEALRAWGKYWDDTQSWRKGDIPETQAEYNARIERLGKEADAETK